MTMKTTETGHIHIVVNGEKQTVPARSTVLDLLKFLQLDPERVAVEKDRAIIRKPAWPSTEIEPGAEFEIVQFVGGG